MNTFRLVFLFALCLLIKVSNAAGASEGEAGAYDGSDEAGAVTVLGTKQRSSSHDKRIALIPMAGGAIFTGPWRQNITNSYVAGLILDIPMSSMLSAELEGNYGDYRITYVSPFGPYGHDFAIYGIGGNLKLTFLRGIIQPYVGAGVTALYYDGMTYGPPAPFRFSQWQGAGQLMGGLDVAVMESVALGGRAAFVNPMFNTLGPQDRPFYSPEAGALQAAYWRFMGSARVSF